MEALGLTVSVLGLAGLFSTCMEAFEYIQLGRQFGADYDICILRLDVCRLRLMRWAKSVGLDNPESAEEYKASLSTKEYEIAERLLQRINHSFIRLREASEKYEIRAQIRGQTKQLIAVNDVTQDLSPSTERIHLSLQNSVIQRQKSTSVFSKTKWALYDKKRFDSMLDTINICTSDIEKLFPDCQHLKKQKDLCQSAILGFENPQDLTTLKRVAESDPIRQGAIDDELERRGHSYGTIEGEGNADIHAGDTNFGFAGQRHSYGIARAKEFSKMHLGNVNYAQGWTKNPTRHNQLVL